MQGYVYFVGVLTACLKGTLVFWSDNMLVKICKCLFIGVFIIPAVIWTLVVFVIVLLNIVLGKIPLIGTIWAFVATIFVFAMRYIFYGLCNLPELKQYNNFTKTAISNL